VDVIANGGGHLIVQPQSGRIAGVVRCAGLRALQPEREESYLIRLGELKVTRLEFLQAFELVENRPSRQPCPDSPALQQARRQLLDEMTLDLILRQYALERGISVSPAELETAVAEVKADYPPGVSNKFWLNRRYRSRPGNSVCAAAGDGQARGVRAAAPYHHHR